MKAASSVAAPVCRKISAGAPVESTRPASITFGFDTAINTASEALDKLHTTAESHHRVIILELMGRDAGWIALQAGIAGGADVILIPEIPYDLEYVVQKLRERNGKGAKFSIIVVAEGAKSAGSEAQYLEDRDIGGMKRLGGIGEILASQIRDIAEMEVRVTVLGHLQRGGSPSAFDRLLASRFGVMAVHLIAENKIGYMVCLRDEVVSSIPIAEAVAHQKLVPLDSDILITAFSLDVCLGNRRDYISSLKKA